MLHNWTLFIPDCVYLTLFIENGCDLAHKIEEDKNYSLLSHVSRSSMNLLRAAVKPGTSLGLGGYKSAQCAVPSMYTTSLFGIDRVNGVMMPSACQGSTFPLEKKVFDVTMSLPPNASSLQGKSEDMCVKGQRKHTHPLGVWCQRNSKSVLARSQKVIESDTLAEGLLIELSSLKVAVFSASLICPASSCAGGLQILDGLVVRHFHASSARKKVREINPSLNSVADGEKGGAHGFHVLGHVVIIVPVILNNTTDSTCKVAHEGCRVVVCDDRSASVEITLQLISTSG